MAGADQPAKGVLAVRDAVLEARLRELAVVDAQHRHAGLPGEPLDDPAVRAEPTHEEGAAVEVEHRTVARRAVRGCHELTAPGPRGDDAVAGCRATGEARRA